LIVQARLYQALMRTKDAAFRQPESSDDWQQLFRLEQQDAFRWKAEIEGAPDFDETLSVSDAYLRERFHDWYVFQT
jgi:hypothetical protein